MTQTIRSNITSKAQNYCPISTCAEVIADHWSIIVLRDIAICNQRTFRSILANNNERISSGVLAGRLKRLTDIGLLYFKDDPAHLQRKIYCLSPAAIDLVPILIDMSAWALTHTSPSKEPIALPSSMDRPTISVLKRINGSIAIFALRSFQCQCLSNLAASDIALTRALILMPCVILILKAFHCVG